LAIIVGILGCVFSQKKAQEFGKFEEWLEIVEAKSGKKLKTSRMDHGGEFLLREFIVFCKDNGIKRQLTMAHTLEQNGFVDQKNYTVVKNLGSMLNGKELPNSFWVKEVNGEVNILN